MIDDKLLDEALERGWSAFWEQVGTVMENEVNTAEPAGQDAEDVYKFARIMVKRWAWQNTRKSFWKVMVVVIEPNTRFPLRHEILFELSSDETDVMDEQECWEKAEEQGKEYAARINMEFSLVDKLQTYSTRRGDWEFFPRMEQAKRERFGTD